MFSFYCQRLVIIVTAPTQRQPNLNVVGGWTRKWLCKPHPTPPPHPPTQTQCQQYLCCYWPDFDQTLKISAFLLSQPQLNDNLTSTVVGGWTWKWLCTPPHPTPPTQTQCQQYLSCYWPDFDQTLGRFLRPFWTDFNCQCNLCPGYICPGNICLGDICQYKEYLSCY